MKDACHRFQETLQAGEEASCLVSDVTMLEIKGLVRLLEQPPILH